MRGWSAVRSQDATAASLLCQFAPAARPDPRTVSPPAEDTMLPARAAARAIHAVVEIAIVGIAAGTVSSKVVASLIMLEEMASRFGFLVFLCSLRGGDALAPPCAASSSPPLSWPVPLSAAKPNRVGCFRLRGPSAAVEAAAPTLEAAFFCFFLGVGLLGPAAAAGKKSALASGGSIVSAAAQSLPSRSKPLMMRSSDFLLPISSLGELSATFMLGMRISSSKP